MILYPKGVCRVLWRFPGFKLIEVQIKQLKPMERAQAFEAFVLFSIFLLLSL